MELIVFLTAVVALLTAMVNLSISLKDRKKKDHRSGKR